MVRALKDATPLSFQCDWGPKEILVRVKRAAQTRKIVDLVTRRDRDVGHVRLGLWLPVNSQFGV